MSKSSVRAAVFHGAAIPLELREVPRPRLAAGQLLVRVECCTICGSDLHTLLGRRQEPTPTILGHEICGVVEELSDPAPLDLLGAPVRVGDRVTWSTAVSCGGCDRCLGGWPQKCRTLRKFGHEPFDGEWPLSGGLADCVLLPVGARIVKVSPSLPAAVICPANCATATVAGACRLAGDLRGRRVLVVGAGMLGLTAAALARSQGAGLVAVCDVDPARLELASRFGAQVKLVGRRPSPEFAEQCVQQCGTRQFDVVLELSGAADAVELACGLADVGGVVVLVGSVMSSPKIQVDPERIVRHCVTIRGLHNYAPVDLLTAVQFLDQHHTRFPFANLVARTFRLSEVQEALEFAIQQRPVRVAVAP